MKFEVYCLNIKNLFILFFVYLLKVNWSNFLVNNEWFFVNELLRLKIYGKILDT